MRFSAIIATSNSEKTIERCLRSFEGFDPQFQIIIVDNQSTDGTLEIVDKVRPNIKGEFSIISEDDAGIYDAWNKGVDVAKNPWIFFLGSDDFIICENFHILYDHLFREKRLVSFGQMKEKWNGKMVFRRFVGCSATKAYCGKMPPHNSLFYHRSIFSEFGCFDTSFKIFGDYEHYKRIASLEIESTPILLTVFSWGGVTNSAKHFEMKFSEWLRLDPRNKEIHRVIKFIFEHLIAVPLRSLLRRCLL